MAVNKPINTQIENRNFLQPRGFMFQVNRAPKVSYFGRKINIPSLEFDTTEQPNYLRKIPLPGTIIDFEDLTFEFLVDEDLKNYMEIQSWIRGVGFPESLDEIYAWQKTDPTISVQQEPRSQLNLYSDGTMSILDSMNNAQFKVKYQNLFPYRLSTLDFDATLTNAEYLTASVSFKYMIYNIEEITSCC